MTEHQQDVASVSFDIVDHLKTPEDIAEYINQILRDGDAQELNAALGHIARLHGMTQLAQRSGLGRESLYKALKTGSHPRFETVQRVFRALHLRLIAVPDTE